MDKLRLRFEKTGRSKYISHLDLMRVLQRAFTRAGLRLKYSEGFNPHAQLSIALPLSVGVESVCELLDFRLAEETPLDAVPERLNAALPEGIRALEVYEAERKPALIKWLLAACELEYDSGEIPSLAEFFSRESIVVPKKTKKGVADADIRPMIASVSQSGAVLSAVVSAQDPTLSPELLVTALRTLAPELAPDFARFRRLELFDAEMKIFR